MVVQMSLGQGKNLQRMMKDERPRMLKNIEELRKKSNELSYIKSFTLLLRLRLGAQSVTLLSTLRDPTQLRRHLCAFRKQPLFFVHM